VRFAGEGAGQVLAFVSSAADAPPPRDDTRIVVLDTAWTPGPGSRPDLIPVRPAMTSVLASADLFEESLTLLDTWASAAGMDDLLLADGVAWWYRIRPFIWYELQELLLWCRVVAEITSGAVVRVPVPTACRQQLVAALVAAADAGQVHLETVPEAGEMDALAVGASATAASASRTDQPLRAPSPVGSPPPAGPASGLAARVIRRLHRVLGAAPSQPPTPASELRRRVAILNARAEALAGRPGAVLVVAHPRVFQVMGQSGSRLVDPQLEPVIARLGTRGQHSFTVALEMDHQSDDDWPAIDADAAILPASFLRLRWGGSEDAGIASSPLAARVAAIDVSLDVDGVDLAPPVVAAIGRYASRWLDEQRRVASRVERLVAELRPAALFLNHEGIRTPWLAGARRRGIPIVAVQHGVIYPTHPVYRHARLPAIPLPDVTCVYGPYERASLLEHGGYLPEEVVVTGSPRFDAPVTDAKDPAAREEERQSVRRELGVTDGDRLLVVSTANMFIVGNVHMVDMIARTLGGPLPGVHVIFKQHPGEADAGPYRRLLEGLAVAGGYSAPRMTTVRDIDLYRLLRTADAHLGLHSTVLTDAVAAGTPNLISVDQAYGDLLGYVEAGVARPVRGVADVLAALDEPRAPDPEARAAFLARHFLAGDAAGRIDAVLHSLADAAARAPA
jgi:hypothetical protein